MGYDLMRTLADVDGDRKADYCRFVGDGNHPKLACATAKSGFRKEIHSNGSVNVGLDWVRTLADVDGDKKADYCRFVRSKRFPMLACTTAKSGFMKHIVNPAH